MAAILPPFPRFVFAVFEPISLIAGAVAPFVSAEWFVSEQIPRSPAQPLTSNAQMVAYQLGNMYLLSAMMGLAILYTTTEPKVVRNYLIVLWLADITHVAITCYVMDNSKLFDVGAWNSVTFGNIGITAGLFITRTSYLLGLFGPNFQPPTAAKKHQ